MNAAPTRPPRVAAGALGLASTLVLGALATGSATAAPTPVPVGTPPVAVITVTGDVYAGVPTTLSGAQSSTPGGAIAEWEWDLNGDGRFERSSTSTPFATKTFRAGNRTVTLRVRNESGLVSSTTKSVTVGRAPSATLEPSAPAAVEAEVDGTSITVTWEAGLGGTPLTYRVSSGPTPDDTVYVPASEPPTATFANLVPGTYPIDVVAVNAAGAGPAGSTEATILPKGVASSSPSASASQPDPTASPEPADSTGAPTPAAADSSTDRTPVGVAMIGVGVVLLVVAGVVALLGLRRRTSTEPGSHTGGGASV